MNTELAELRRKARERKFLAFRRHYIDGATYRELSPEFGVSRERVRQMCCQAALILCKPEYRDHPLQAFVRDLIMDYTD